MCVNHDVLTLWSNSQVVSNTISCKYQCSINEHIASCQGFAECSCNMMPHCLIVFLTHLTYFFNCDNYKHQQWLRKIMLKMFDCWLWLYSFFALRSHVLWRQQWWKIPDDCHIVFLKFRSFDPKLAAVGQWHWRISSMCLLFFIDWAKVGDIENGRCYMFTVILFWLVDCWPINDRGASIWLVVLTIDMVSFVLQSMFLFT